MDRIIMLSATFLMMLGGTSSALPESVNIYDFYDAPSSGALAATTGTDIHNANPMFRVVPKGGFGPSTASFQIQNGRFSASKPRSTLQFKERWLFDYASGSHRPRHQHHQHHQQHHRRSWARSVDD